MSYQVRRRVTPPMQQAHQAGLPYQEHVYIEESGGEDAIIVYEGDVLREQPQPSYDSRTYYANKHNRVNYKQPADYDYQDEEEYDQHGAYGYADYTTIIPRQKSIDDYKMVILLGTIIIVLLMAIIVTQFLIPRGQFEQRQFDALPPPSGQTGQTDSGRTIVPTTLSPLFMPSVLYWEDLIVNWANVYGVDPNAVATIMQIESCGDPQAISVAGAQGLFQVMPFHFEQGESMLDPDTNAKRGVAYFAQGMEMTGGDPYLSFAGYNGGHGTAARNWSSWPSETQRYYVWGKGIYDDVSTNQTYSTTLAEWLNSGGRSLCNQANTRLGI